MMLDCMGIFMLSIVGRVQGSWFGGTTCRGLRWGCVFCSGLLLV